MANFASLFCLFLCFLWLSDNCIESSFASNKAVLNYEDDKAPKRSGSARKGNNSRKSKFTEDPEIDIFVTGDNPTNERPTNERPTNERPTNERRPLIGVRSVSGRSAANAGGSAVPNHQPTNDAQSANDRNAPDGDNVLPGRGREAFRKHGKSLIAAAFIRNFGPNLLKAVRPPLRRRTTDADQSDRSQPAEDAEPTGDVGPTTEELANPDGHWEMHFNGGKFLNVNIKISCPSNQMHFSISKLNNWKHKLVAVTRMTFMVATDLDRLSESQISLIREMFTAMTGRVQVIFDESSDGSIKRLPFDLIRMTWIHHRGHRERHGNYIYATWFDLTKAPVANSPIYMKEMSPQYYTSSCSSNLYPPLLINNPSLLITSQVNEMFFKAMISHKKQISWVESTLEAYDGYFRTIDITVKADKNVVLMNLVWRKLYGLIKEKSDDYVVHDTDGADDWNRFAVENDKFTARFYDFTKFKMLPTNVLDVSIIVSGNYTEQRYYPLAEWLVSLGYLEHLDIDDENGVLESAMELYRDMKGKRDADSIEGLANLKVVHARLRRDSLKLTNIFFSPAKKVSLDFKTISDEYYMQQEAFKQGWKEDGPHDCLLRHCVWYRRNESDGVRGKNDELKGSTMEAPKIGSKSNTSRTPYHGVGVK